PSSSAACNCSRAVGVRAPCLRASRSATAPNPYARGLYPSVSTASYRCPRPRRAPWSCAYQRANQPDTDARLHKAAPRSLRRQNLHRPDPFRRLFDYSNSLHRLSASRSLLALRTTTYPPFGPGTAPFTTSTLSSVSTSTTSRFRTVTLA